MPVMFVSTAGFCAVAYDWVGLNPDPGRFAVFAGTLLLSNLVGSALMIAVGTLTRRAAAANLLGALVLLFTILLCGLFLNNIELGGAAWVANLSFLHFTFEALLVNEMSGLALRICAGADNCFKTTAEYILQGGFFGLNVDHVHQDIAILGLLFVALNVVTYLLLKFWVREQR